MMKRTVYILLLLVVTLTSCDTFNKVYKTNNYDYRYETAKAYYLEGKYLKASDLLESMVTMLKGGDKAEESLVLLARCYYESKDYETASQYFKVHYTNYPRGEYAEYTRFYSGKSLFMGTPEPELDQSNTYAAINELQLFMEYYPHSSYNAEAQEMIMKMHDVLVKKMYLSAKLYYDLGDLAYIGNNYNIAFFNICYRLARNCFFGHRVGSLLKLFKGRFISRSRLFCHTCGIFCIKAFL